MNTNTESNLDLDGYGGDPDRTVSASFGESSAVGFSTSIFICWGGGDIEADCVFDDDQAEVEILVKTDASAIAFARAIIELGKELDKALKRIEG